MNVTPAKCGRQLSAWRPIMGVTSSEQKKEQELRHKLIFHSDRSLNACFFISRFLVV